MVTRLKVPVLLLVAVAAVIYLVATGVARNDIYMSTLEQLDRQRALRETVRIMGFVDEGSVAEDATRLLTRFTLRNEARTLALPVAFEGVTPDMFREGAAVVASGRLGGDGTFAASELMTKCPSKYEGMETPPGHGDPGAAVPAGPAAALTTASPPPGPAPLEPAR